jgi:hypothetical protein
MRKECARSAQNVAAQPTDDLRQIAGRRGRLSGEVVGAIPFVYQAAPWGAFLYHPGARGPVPASTRIFAKNQSRGLKRL